MGRQRTEGMIRFAGREAALRDHLQCNHYPPISLRFLEAAREAIRQAQEDPDSEITLPNGRVLAAGRIVEELHLEPFLDPDPDFELDPEELFEEGPEIDPDDPSTWPRTV